MLLGDQRADLRQTFGISFERMAGADQLLSQIAGREIAARDAVYKSDALIAARKEPEIVPLAVVLLGIKLGEDRSFFLQNVVDIRGVSIAYNLLVIFVFLHNDHNVVVHRETRTPRKGQRNIL